MPSRHSSRSSRSLYKTERNEDGVKMYTWDAVRRQNLRNLRRQTKSILLLMAVLEAIRLGPVELVRQGQEGYPMLSPEENYGIAYNLGYFFSWLYMCVFMVVFVPLFSWWLPHVLPITTDTQGKATGKATEISNFLRRLNLILLPATIGICLVQHIYYTFYTFIYVDARPVKSYFALPSSTRRNWLARLAMLAGVLISMGAGKGAFAILADMGLARVKCIEYCVIVLPIQVNIGIALGSLVQWKVEKRALEKKAAMKRLDAETAVAADEKTELLVTA